MKSFASVTVGATLVSLLAGCAVSTPFQRPETAMPGQWTGVPATSSTNISSDWWKQYGNLELNQLMDQAMIANHDLAAAVARIQQARAAASAVDANRYPSVNAGTSSSRSNGTQGAGDAGRQAQQLTANVAYEVDLWGGKSAATNAANARVASTVYDRDAVALVLQSDLAASYFQVLAIKDRLALARKNLEAAQNVLKLVETRYSKGANTGLEVAQQRTTVLNIAAQIPQLEQDLSAAQTALAVLLGQTPQSFSVKGHSLAGLNAPAVAAFQPPALLERRPDIKAAEARLAAANADIGAARSALYPRLTLSASSIASGLLGSGSGLVTSLLGSLTQTIFDGGRLQSQVTQSEARKTELVEQYLGSVLVSLKEVQDSLGAVAASQARQGLLKQSAQEAQEAYRIATVRYNAGSQDLLTLLDAQRTLLQVEDNRIQSDLSRLTSTVGLYKALGGGWKSDAS